MHSLVLSHFGLVVSSEPASIGEKLPDMHSNFFNNTSLEMHENDYIEALDIAMSNLAADGEQPFLTE